MDESKLFLKKIEDRYDQFLNYQTIMASDFLTMEQQSMLAPFLREHRGTGVFLFGGFEDAERRQVLFMPEYTEVKNEEEALEYFKENPEACPEMILECTVSKHDVGKLGHRDYLGALMGEGIKREIVGDILVNPNGAQIVVSEDMAEYLKKEFTKAGHTTFETSLKHVSEISLGEVRKEVQRHNVASPRLDNVVSSVFGVSRKDAVTAISRGIVFVDGAEMLKPDYQLKEGQKLVLRGKGKAIYLGQTGTSKKGKAYIEVEKYI